MAWVKVNDVVLVNTDQVTHTVVTGSSGVFTITFYLTDASTVVSPSYASAADAEAALEAALQSAQIKDL